MTIALTDIDYGALSAADRIRLAHNLLGSVHDELNAAPDPEEIAFIRRRVAEADADPSPGVSWAELRASLFSRLT